MKRYIHIVLLYLIAFTAFPQSAELETYTELYNSAGSVNERYVVLRNMAEAKIDGAGEFLTSAIHQLLLEYPSINERSELDAADSIARIVAAQIGDEKYADAGADLWKVVDVFSNPLVKADAIIALGKIGASEYLPQVIQILTDLNASAPPANDDLRLRRERIAYGAIISLENYKDPSGYLPVFFASTGWYSERIKNQASISLSQIMEDPIEPLTSVIKGSGYSYDMKHLALRTIERSEVAGSSKAGAAVAALAESLRAASNNPRQRTELSNMRKLALSMIRRYGTEDAAVYPLMESSYSQGDLDEKLSVITGLGVLAGDDAGRILSSFLRNIHDRWGSNIRDTNDDRLARAIIAALGAVKSSAGKPVLLLVQQSSVWPNSIKRLASEALKNIQ
jgi:hypothetical protein